LATTICSDVGVGRIGQAVLEITERIW